MKFNADGSLKGLTCGPVHTAVLTDATASGLPTTDNGRDGVSPGLDGFVMAQDITSTRPRGQSFQITTANQGNFASVTMALFQTDIGGNAPNADLTVSLYDVVGTFGVPGASPLAQATVPQSQISWAPRSVTVNISAPVAANPDGTPHQYAIVLSTTSTTGAYGVARADGTTGDLDPTGSGLVGTSDGTWTLEPANDLRYALTTIARTV